MRYEERKDADFKRLTGVSHATFKKMLAVVKAGMPSFGCPPKLSREDQLLMTLMYWREYRSRFHIAQTYGVSEATVSRTIRKVEDILIRSKQFHLPGKKALQPSDTLTAAFRQRRASIIRSRRRRKRRIGLWQGSESTQKM